MFTTLGPFLNGLRDGLSIRAGLSGVVISTGPLADATGGQESIEFGHVDNTIDWYNIGRKARKETYTLSGWVFVVKFGADETVITEARERCLALLTEVNACLVDDPTVGGAVTTSGITSFSLDQVITGANTNARGAAIEFTLTVEAINRPGS